MIDGPTPPDAHEVTLPSGAIAISKLLKDSGATPPPTPSEKPVVTSKCQVPIL